MKPLARREKTRKTIKSVRTHEATMAALGVAVGPKKKEFTYIPPVGKPSNMEDYRWDDVRPFDTEPITGKSAVHVYQKNIAPSGRYRGIDRRGYWDRQNEFKKTVDISLQKHIADSK